MRLAVCFGFAFALAGCTTGMAEVPYDPEARDASLSGAVDVPSADAPSADAPSGDAPSADVASPDAGSLVDVAGPSLDLPTPDVLEAGTFDAAEAAMPDVGFSDVVDASFGDVVDAPPSDTVMSDVVDAPPACPGALTSCSGACVDLRTSTSHCGVCGRACRASEPCVAGVCRDLCAGNTCSGHGWCQAGACLCDPGYAGASCAFCDGVWQAVPGVSPVVCQPARLVDGTPGDDTIAGSPEPDMIRGLDGNDTIQGLDGNDFVNGNNGIDTVNGNVGRDEVHGGSGNDLVQGGSGDDLVMGDLGDDRIVGGGGNDRLVGGEGNDTLEGMDGDDRYTIDGLGVDVIDDLSGFDAARCVPGVFAVSNTLVGADRVLRLNTGGSVTIRGDRVESILGCD